MASFEPAIGRVLREEGGYVNDPDDPGGATNYGISLRWLKGIAKRGDFDDDGDVDAQDIRLIDSTRAIELYREFWWDKFKYGELESQSVANSLFSFSINMGSRRAHKLIQRALLACGFTLDVDGQLGPISRTAISRADPAMLLGALRAEAAAYYRLLVTLKPKRAKFLKGWLRRAYT